MHALTFVLALAAADPAPAPAPIAAPNAAIGFTSDAIAWKDAPPTLPKGAVIALLEGDPAQAGIVTMRMRLPKGARLAQHTHPTDERVTVLAGTMKVTIGTLERAFGAGSYYVTPKGTKHSVAVDEDTTIQITVLGPWRLEYTDAR